MKMIQTCGSKEHSRPGSPLKPGVGPAELRCLSDTTFPHALQDTTLGSFLAEAFGRVCFLLLPGDGTRCFSHLEHSPLSPP